MHISACSPVNNKGGEKNTYWPEKMQIIIIMMMLMLQTAPSPLPSQLLYTLLPTHSQIKPVNPASLTYVLTHTISHPRSLLPHLHILSYSHTHTHIPSTSHPHPHLNTLSHSHPHPNPNTIALSPSHPHPNTTTSYQ